MNVLVSGALRREPRASASYRSSRRRSLGAALVLGVMPMTTLHGQEDEPTRWRVRVAPYLWLSNITGTNTIHDLIVPLADSALQANWSARVEVGHWRIHGIFEYARAAHSGAILRTSPAPTVGSYDLDVTDLEITAAVEIGPLSRSPDIELLVGLRSIRQRQAIALETPAVSERAVTAHWEKILLGTRYCTRLGGRFWFSLRADVGGDLFWGSDFTWALDGEFGARLAPMVDAILRYKYMEFEYDNDQEGEQAYSWDQGRTQGWFLGIAFRL